MPAKLCLLNSSNQRRTRALFSSVDIGVPPSTLSRAGTQKTGARHTRRGRFHLLLPAAGVTTQRQASAGGGSSSSSPTSVPVPWPGAGARYQDGASPSLRAILWRRTLSQAAVLSIHGSERTTLA